MLQNLFNGDDDPDFSILQQEAISTAAEEFKPMIDKARGFIGPISKIVFKKLIGLLSGKSKDKKDPNATKQKIMVLMHDEKTGGLNFLLLDADKVKMQYTGKDAFLPGSRQITEPDKFVEGFLLGDFLGQNKPDAQQDDKVKQLPAG